MKKLLNVAIFVGSLFILPTAYAMPSIKMQVNGLVCAFCAQGIEKKIKALPQTKAVFVSLKHKIVAVEVIDGTMIEQVTLDKLIKDSGYVLVKTEIVNQPIAHIKAEVMGKHK